MRYGVALGRVVRSICAVRALLFAGVRAGVRTRYTPLLAGPVGLTSYLAAGKFYCDGGAAVTLV